MAPNCLPKDSFDIVGDSSSRELISNESQMSQMRKFGFILKNLKPIFAETLGISILQHRFSLDLGNFNTLASMCAESSGISLLWRPFSPKLEEWTPTKP